MNIDNWDLTLNQIKDHPETWDQTQWHCGTTHCFAGWAQILSGKRAESLTAREHAMGFLEIDEVAARYFFSINRVLSDFEFDDEGYNSIGRCSGYGRDGYTRDGYDSDGYTRDGYDRGGYDRGGYDRGGYTRSGYDSDGYDCGGYNRSGYDSDGYDCGGYNRSGYDSSGYDRGGYDRSGYDSDGRNSDWFDRS